MKTIKHRPLRLAKLRMQPLCTRLLCVLLSLLFLSPLLSCTGNTPQMNESGAMKLTFSGAIEYGTLQSMEGKTVTILGYMATLSPVKGDFVYLMNLPYQSCPYCVPNTSQLSNTMAVYAPSGKTFTFTDGPIQVTGKLELGDFTDEFGYTYNYRIVDAAYRVVDSASLSGNMKLWQRISDEGISAEVYAMFDYIYFLCNWTEYTAQFEEGEDYLYPTDIGYFKENQFAKESAADYFDTLCTRAEAFDEADVLSLVPIIRRAEALGQSAQAELDAGNYAFVDGKYVLNNSKQLLDEWDASYRAFADWLEQFTA